MARAERKNDSTWKMVKYDCPAKIFLYVIKKADFLTCSSGLPIKQPQ